MRALISINSKFMTISPKELISFIINNSKYTKGLELYINYHKKDELEYLSNLVDECKNNGFILQIHGDSSLSMEDQLEYMKILEKMSDFLNYKINIVMHPICLDTKEESINATISYVSELLDNIDNSKLNISLENLNDLYNIDRLNKEDLTNIILNDERLSMTYDIGHELIDCGKITDVDEYLIQKISNVHIHTYDYNYDSGYDHKVILKNDKYWNELLKAITFLKVNHYDYNVVFEYALDFCEGKDIYEKILYYLKSIDYVYERIM